VDAYTDTKMFAEEMNARLGERAENTLAYLRRSAKTYEKIGTVFINHSLHKRRTWLNKRTVRALSALRFGFLFSTLNKYNARQFDAPESVQLFNRFATYNGSNPYKAPGMLSLIPHLEQNQGTFYPAGGMISITNALYELAKKKGVLFHFDTPVTRIIHHEGKVRGVVVNDENIPAGIVVSNGDVYFTCKNLLRSDHRAKKLLRQERSSSAVIFYWGIKKNFDSLLLHNILFSADYKKEFAHIFTSKKITDDPTVYINITSKMEPSLAPSGCENWFVMVNAPANAGQNWEQVKHALRKTVITKINRMLSTDIEPMIATEHTLDPLQIEAQTGSSQGALYGTSSNSRLSAFFRHPNDTATIRGLYFCGGSVHPGGGIPLCFKSARIVSELIRDQNKSKLRS
jgi:phytoene desaturase